MNAMQVAMSDNGGLGIAGAMVASSVVLSIGMKQAGTQAATILVDGFKPAADRAAAGIAAIGSACTVVGNAVSRPWLRHLLPLRTCVALTWGWV